MAGPPPVRRGPVPARRSVGASAASATSRRSISSSASSSRVGLPSGQRHDLVLHVLQVLGRRDAGGDPFGVALGPRPHGVDLVVELAAARSRSPISVCASTPALRSSSTRPVPAAISAQFGQGRGAGARRPRWPGRCGPRPAGGAARMDRLSGPRTTSCRACQPVWCSGRRPVAGTASARPSSNGLGAMTDTRSPTRPAARAHVPPVDATLPDGRSDPASAGCRRTSPTITGYRCPSRTGRAGSTDRSGCWTP